MLNVKFGSGEKKMVVTSERTMLIKVTADNFDWCWMKLYQQRVFDVICDASRREDAFRVEEENGVMTYKLFELRDGVSIDLTVKTNADNVEFNVVTLKVDFHDGVTSIYLARDNDACKCINKFREYVWYTTNSESICKLNQRITKITKTINAFKKKMKSIFN